MAEAALPLVKVVVTTIHMVTIQEVMVVVVAEYVLLIIEDQQLELDNYQREMVHILQFIKMIHPTEVEEGVIVMEGEAIITTSLYSAIQNSWHH